jgi:hypothetical protein
MSDKPTDNVALIEELEQRNMLSQKDKALVVEMRNRGMIKSGRNPALLRLEEKIMNTDPKDLDDLQARSMANTYRTLKDGNHDDHDGKVRYGKELGGREYYQLIRDELSGVNISKKFNDELAQFDAADANGKIAKSQELIRKETDKLSNQAIRVNKQSIVRQVSTGINVTEDENILDLPDVRTERERLAEEDPSTMSDPDKARLVEIGRHEAFKRSYVPVREFLESKLSRDRFAMKVATDAISKGGYDEEAYNILNPETKAFVRQYVRHSRAMDVREGLLGTLEETGRKALTGLWDLPTEHLPRLSADLTVATSAALWALPGLVAGDDEMPIQAIKYLDEWEREQQDRRDMNDTFSLKAPERSRLGAASVGLGETAPHMAALIFGGGPGMVFAGAAAARHGKQRILDLGGTVEESNVGGALIGLTAVYVESLGGFGAKTAIGKYLSKPLLTKATSRTMLGYVAKNIPRFVEDVSRTWAAETLEEMGEAFANDITEQVFVKFDMGNIRKIDFSRALQKGFREGAEASDVTGLMSLLGGGGSMLRGLSANAGEVTFNKASLDKIGSQAQDYINNNVEDIVDGLENVNDVIIDTWANNNRTEARRLLIEMGISKEALAEAEPTLNTMVKLQKQIKKDIDTAAKSIEATEARYDKLRPVLDRIGVDSRDVQQLTDSLDPKNVGSYRAGVIETRDGIKDKSRVWNHEAFHFAIEQMGLTEKQWQALSIASYNSVMT